MKVVLDTNIFISSLNFGGTPDLVLKEVFRGNIEVLISENILDELEEVLGRKFNWEKSRVVKTINNLRELCRVVKTKTKVRIIKKDLDDNKILECAIDGKADYIITGDKKHLLPLKKFKGIPILSPQQFLKEVLYD